MDSPYMDRVAEGVAECGIRVVRFEFPYMAARRSGGKRGAPDREPVLLDSWRQVVAELGGGPSVVIGGKSMGGRMASLIADELHVRGLVCLGYPFHPPGQPEKLRTKHLAALKTRALVIQGERDPIRDAARGFAIRAFAIDPCRVDHGRRPFLQAAGQLGSHRKGQPQPRDRVDLSVRSPSGLDDGRRFARILP